MSNDQKTLQEKAVNLIKDARAAEWAIIKAEEFQEKFELSNKVISIIAAMKWYERAFKYKKLMKQYLLQLDEIDKKYRKQEADYQKKLVDDSMSDPLDQKG